MPIFTSRAMAIPRPSAQAGWPLVEAGEGVSISFHFDKQPKEKILAKISQQTMMNRSRMRDVADTRQDFEELDSAIASGMYLKDVMNRQGEDFYYMHTLIEVTAGDPKRWSTASRQLKSSVSLWDMIARRCEYKQEQAFFVHAPPSSISTRILNANPGAMRLPAVWRQRFHSHPMSYPTATASSLVSICTTVRRSF